MALPLLFYLSLAAESLNGEQPPQLGITMIFLPSTDVLTDLWLLQAMC